MTGKANYFFAFFMLLQAFMPCHSCRVCNGTPAAAQMVPSFSQCRLELLSLPLIAPSIYIYIAKKVTWLLSYFGFRFLSFAFFSSFSSPNYAMHCRYNESEHRKEQLATRINTIPQQIWTLFTFSFAKRRIQCNIRLRFWRSRPNSPPRVNARLVCSQTTGRNSCSIVTSSCLSSA